MFSERILKEKTDDYDQRIKRLNRILKNCIENINRQEKQKMISAIETM